MKRKKMTMKMMKMTMMKKRRRKKTKKKRRKKREEAITKTMSSLRAWGADGVGAQRRRRET